MYITQKLRVVIECDRSHTCRCLNSNRISLERFSDMYVRPIVRNYGETGSALKWRAAA